MFGGEQSEKEREEAIQKLKWNAAVVMAFIAAVRLAPLVLDTLN